MADGRPPQIISGGGGTELETNKAGTFTGLPIDGSTFSLAWQEADFGYVRMDRAAEGGTWPTSSTCPAPGPGRGPACSRRGRSPARTEPRGVGALRIRGTAEAGLGDCAPTVTAPGGAHVWGGDQGEPA